MCFAISKLEKHQSLLYVKFAFQCSSFKPATICKSYFLLSTMVLEFPQTDQYLSQNFHGNRLRQNNPIKWSKTLNFLFSIYTDFAYYTILYQFSMKILHENFVECKLKCEPGTKRNRSNLNLKALFSCPFLPPQFKILGTVHRHDP